MTLIEDSLSTDDGINSQLETGLCSPYITESEERRDEAWLKLSVQLYLWKKTPGFIDEDDIESPTLKAINKAEIWLKDYQQYRIQQRLYRPIRIVLNGEGGICFRVIDKANSISETFEIDFDGSVEYFCIKNGKMLTKKTIG